MKEANENTALERLHRLTKKLEEKEKNLQLSNERMELILDSCNAGTWEWFVEKDQLFWNKRMVELWGYNPNALEKVGDYYKVTYDHFIDHLDEKHRHRVNNAVQCSLAEGTRYSVEYKVNRPDGSSIMVHASGRGYPKHSETPERMLGVCLLIDSRCDCD